MSSESSQSVKKTPSWEPSEKPASTPSSIKKNNQREMPHLGVNSQNLSPSSIPTILTSQSNDKRTVVPNAYPVRKTSLPSLFPSHESIKMPTAIRLVIASKSPTWAQNEEPITAPSEIEIYQYEVTASQGAKTPSYTPKNIESAYTSLSYQ